MIIYITGTGTGIGKTFVTKAIINNLINKFKIVGIKPIAAGIEKETGFNEDVQILSSVSGLRYEESNLYCFQKPVSPHIGADEEKAKLDFNVIKDWIHELDKKNDFVLVEGVGGLLSPIDQFRTNIDLIKYLNLPVIVVVGLKLGCINDALLTFEKIKSEGLNVNGWIANLADQEMLEVKKNLDYLVNKIDYNFYDFLDFGVDSFEKELLLERVMN